MLGKVMSAELENFRKEIICGLLQNLTGGSEEFYKKPSGLAVIRPRFETGVLHLQA